MLAGKRIERCSSCYHSESLGRESLRQIKNGQFFGEQISESNSLFCSRVVDQIDPLVAKRPIWFDVRLGNICNLKCRMCCAEASSQIEKDEIAEAEIAGIQHQAIGANISDWAEARDIMKRLKSFCAEAVYLEAVGAEPTLNEAQLELLEFFVSEGSSNKIGLFVISNLTNALERPFALFSRFKNPQVQISLDGSSSVYDYIRFPAKWDNITKNIETVRRRYPQISFTVGPTFQAYNILNITDLFDWCRENELKFSTFNLLDWPSFLSVRVLPLEARELAAERLENWAEKNDIDNKNGVIQLAAYLRDHANKATEKDIYDFVKYTEKMDRSRGQDIRLSLPELFGIWVKHRRPGFATRGTRSSSDRAARGPRPRANHRPPVAVVIGPAWLRTGTGRVIEDQIAYYRDRGFSTAFVGVPTAPGHGPENPMWMEQADAASELRADHASFAILDAPQNPKSLRRRIRQFLAPRTSLDWIVEIGHCSRPPPALFDYLRNRSVALLHVNHVFTLGFARRLRRKLKYFGQRLPLLVETHDVQSQILSERNERNPWTGRPDDLASLLSAEKALLREANVLAHCSVEDQRFFSEQFPEKPQFLVRPVIDNAFVAAVAGAKEIAPIDILLVGTNHHANAEAVEWFLTEVWPLIANRRYTVRIVGGVNDMVRQRRLDLYYEFYGFFLGRVADLAPYYRAARSVIAPMRSGGGISVKTIEAFALGIPFIGTAKAYRGLPPEPLARHGIQIHDEPRAFADALLRTLSGSDDTGKRGRAIYEELFSKETCYAARDTATRVIHDIHARARNERDSSAIRMAFNEEGNAP
jgi:sulfatase maturation enzyme AslB (radical SAM superfamily)/glycosyltransferase involved in cell wall biosynthesis